MNEKRQNKRRIFKPPFREYWSNKNRTKQDSNQQIMPYIIKNLKDLNSTAPKQTVFCAQHHFFDTDILPYIKAKKALVGKRFA